MTLEIFFFYHKKDDHRKKMVTKPLLGIWSQLNSNLSAVMIMFNKF